MRNRTLALVGAALLGTALVLGTLSTGLAQSQPQWGPGGMIGPGGMMGGGGPMSGPMTGGPGMMGPGMGPLMGGPGMMGGYGPGGMMGGPWSGAARTVAPLRTLAEAGNAFQAYLDRIGNPDLALDEVMEFERNYYAIVKQQSTGSGAFELLADKQTGVVFPEHGPNMMWNTTYGHMAGSMMGGWGATGGTTTVTPERATQIAQQWLDANQPGSGTEQPAAFPGYYTLHTVRDGRITGMLSVNAATGQVWYHAWHGAFVAEAEPGR